ncbi:MAG: hypothetical protein RL375_3815 [Pseudomonadota bacterium]
MKVTSKLNSSFVRLAVVDYIGTANAIGDSLTDNPYYPLDTWPDKVPKPEAIREAAERLRVLAVESQSRDANKIRERNNLRAEIDGMLDEVRAFVEMAAHGNEAALRSTGFALRQTRGAAAPEPLGAPTDLRVKHGRESGTLDVHVRALPGTSSYDIAIAIGEAVTEADWRHAAVSATSMHMLLQGLEPGKYVWVRVRGVNGAGYGLWTPPQRIMVI